MGINVEIDNGTAKADRVRVSVKPPGVAKFKRHRYEHRILELLRHNGLMRDREPGTSAVAAE